MVFKVCRSLAAGPMPGTSPLQGESWPAGAVRLRCRDLAAWRVDGDSLWNQASRLISRRLWDCFPSPPVKLS